MMPTIIEDDEIPEGAVRIIIGPPDGDPTGEIRPVEAIVFHDFDSTVFCMKIALDDDDLKQLMETKHFWISQIGRQLQPFNVFVR